MPATSTAGFWALLLASFAISAQPILKVDFNDRSENDSFQTQSGFSSFIKDGTGIQTAPVTRQFAALFVTLASVGGAGYDDRARTLPVDGGALSEAALYRDFIFADTVTIGGLDVTVAGLTPNGTHRFTVWSFDSSSAGPRVSDWWANGILVTNGYTFDGRVLPTSNRQYSIAFRTTADALGRVFITARRNTASVDGTGNRPIGVFLNALQVELEPRFTRIELSAGTVTLLASPTDPNFPYQLETTTDVARNPTLWKPVLNAVLSRSGEILTLKFPTFDDAAFYRLR